MYYKSSCSAVDFILNIKYDFRYYDTITLSETIRSLNYMGATTNTPDALIVSNLK